MTAEMNRRWKRDFDPTKYGMPEPPKPRSNRWRWIVFFAFGTYVTLTAFGAMISPMRTGDPPPDLGWGGFWAVIFLLGTVAFGAFAPLAWDRGKRRMRGPEALRNVHTRPTDSFEMPKARRALDEMAIASGVSSPRLLVMNGGLNAMLVERDAVAVTPALEAELTEPELRAVIAHILCRVQHESVTGLLEEYDDDRSRWDEKTQTKIHLEVSCAADAASVRLHMEPDALFAALNKVLNSDATVNVRDDQCPALLFFAWPKGHLAGERQDRVRALRLALRMEDAG